MESLRIAIVTENLPSDRLNLQPWRYLGDLAHALRAAGHDAFVLTHEGGTSSWNGVPVEEHPGLSEFRDLVGLRRMSRARRADATLFRLTASLFLSMHDRGGSASLGGKLAGIFLRPLHAGSDLVKRFLDPLLLPEARLDIHHAALYATRRLGAWPRAGSFVDEFLFLWESDRTRAIAAGLPAASCSVIRHPFDRFFMHEAGPDSASRVAEQLTPVPRRIAFVGPPEESRGVSDVLNLGRWLPKEPRTQILLILRDPRFPDPVIRRTRAGPHDVLVIRGLLSREDVRLAYVRAHLAVFPYRFVRTALPLVPLEAVAAGRPVVTTRVHPIRELQPKSGLLFAKPGHPSDIARAITAILDGGGLEESRRRNQEWVRATPDWSVVAAKVVSVLRR